MKIAVVGSRNAPPNAAVLILKQLPSQITEMISGGADGIDSAAQEVAQTLGIPLHVISPDYEQYGRQAPLVRNREIIACADEVLAFWDGKSKGTQYVIAECIKQGKPVRVIPL